MVVKVGASDFIRSKVLSDDGMDPFRLYSLMGKTLTLELEDTRLLNCFLKNPDGYLVGSGGLRAELKPCGHYSWLAAGLRDSQPGGIVVQESRGRTTHWVSSARPLETVKPLASPPLLSWR
jgi:hypothetical protein